jgi:hypothetical protein
MELVAQLADEDVARLYRLTSELLDTTPLGVGITTVATGALTFLMCHFACSRIRFLYLTVPNLSF